MSFLTYHEFLELFNEKTEKYVIRLLFTIKKTFLCIFCIKVLIPDLKEQLSLKLDESFAQ